MAVIVTPAVLVNVSSIPSAVIDGLDMLAPVWMTDNAVVPRWETLLNGPYHVYVDGVKVRRTWQRRYVLHVESSGEYPVVDVLTDEETAGLEDAQSARLELGWLPATLADYYRVQRYQDGGWVTLADIPDRGESRFTYVTDPLDDDADHQFQVRPMRASGAGGTALDISRHMIRNPDPPDVTVTYNDTAGTVTIAAA